MDFKLPEMSKGTIIPNGIANQQLKESKEEELHKQQRKHDYLVTILGGISGAIFGLITSVIFWLITK